MNVITVSGKGDQVGPEIAEIHMGYYEWNLAREFMKRRLPAAERFGKWEDMWVEHPFPTMNEPKKLMSWLTPDQNMDEDSVVDLYLRAGMAMYFRCRGGHLTHLSAHWGLPTGRIQCGMVISPITRQ